jgi:hypothetical protein
MFWGHPTPRRNSNQVLAPRVARLKAALRALKPTRGGGPVGDPAAAAAGGGVNDASTRKGTAAAAPGDGGLAGPRPDKAFVEVLLTAKRLAVVIEHQPVEAWLALHGSALRVSYGLR